MDWKIEVVVIPVTDLDRAKHFYADQCGFVVDLDHQATESIRLIQMTPPGSGCSITIGSGITDAEPGSVRGIQITVDDIDEARAHLIANGVEAGPIQHFTDGVWSDGKGGPWNSFVRFSDPDGNGWVLQERPSG
jgi:catechol 2,3-dioxygenase-like lactoylglutathione lyase family enzyme